MSFSQDLHAIQDIVKKLESAPLPLEEALEEFEKGVGLIRNCQKYLEQAEQKVSLLTEENGEVPWQPLKPSTEEGAGHE